MIGTNGCFWGRTLCLLVLLTMVSLSVSAQEVSPEDQLVIDTMVAGAPSGAIIDMNGICGISPGFFNNGVFVGFGGLFPDDCRNSFERLNPDDSLDWHANGVGSFFLMVFSPSFRVYSSAGSDVRWKLVSHEGGISVFTIQGTLSDGSHVRAHFTVDPSGEDNAKGDFLWVQGLGYVVGGN